MMVDQPMGANGISEAAGGYGPPGYPPPGGMPPGGYGPPGAPPGGYGPPGGAPPGGYGPPGGGAPPPGGYGPPGAPPGGYGPPGGAPPPGGFGAPPPGGGFGGPPAFPPPPGGGFGGPPVTDVNTTLPLILNIAGICCCACFPVGVAGLVLAIQANSAKKMGDAATAQSKAKLALILGIVSLALGFLSLMGYGVMNLLDT